ncbi:hypothetical protein EAS62_39435 [Bradyrhizobium zhanjiangense]|uniref:Uncharacterized protein n=1 Tax=Bradyrhizobium zhanjiangense TaxID=1325107 RepID=A0ABY0D8U6_9BRAD|nr:hypothetical protein EAS62_39435 [Bradyrhizobium zhanjiangense]
MYEYFADMAVSRLMLRRLPTARTKRPQLRAMGRAEASAPKKWPQLAGILGELELGPIGVTLWEGRRENSAIARTFLS